MAPSQSARRTSRGSEHIFETKRNTIAAKAFKTNIVDCSRSTVSNSTSNMYGTDKSASRQPFQGWTLHPTIALPGCAARPWPVFGDAFGVHRSRSIRGTTNLDHRPTYVLF